ncbi:MAG: hypothetical protein KDB01_18545 [Planctomycetaceae bacterium]|nr:hypothetical protein [Planctomycetaceae bacterium]
MRSALVHIAVSYAVATCVAVTAICLWTLSLETIAAGLLVPVALIPAIAGFAIASCTSRTSGTPHVLYVILASPVPLFLLWTTLFPSEGARRDGADQWALAFFIPMVAAAVGGYLVLALAESKKGHRP